MRHDETKQGIRVACQQRHTSHWDNDSSDRGCPECVQIDRPHEQPFGPAPCLCPRQPANRVIEQPTRKTDSTDRVQPHPPAHQVFLGLTTHNTAPEPPCGESGPSLINNALKQHGQQTIHPPRQAPIRPPPIESPDHTQASYSFELGPHKNVLTLSIHQ